MITTTITQKGQATIPVSIRKKLWLHSGSKLVFRFQGDKVFLQKENHSELHNLETTLWEWNNDAAYDRL